MSFAKTKICKHCRIEKPISEFHNSISRKDGKHSWCKVCNNENMHRYYKENKEHVLKATRDYYHKNRAVVKEKQRNYVRRNKDKVNAWYRENSSKIKKRFLLLYGNKCLCCGETTEEFLTLDHIGGRVGEKKKDGTLKAYRDAIKSYPNSKYRILCMNCNFATRYGAICPHQKV